jgi:potassium efflux system protein
MYIAQLLVRGCALLCLLLSFISSIPLWAQVEHDVPLSDAVTSREEFLHKEAADIATEVQELAAWRIEEPNRSAKLMNQRIEQADVDRSRLATETTKFALESIQLDMAAAEQNQRELSQEIQTLNDKLQVILAGPEAEREDQGLNKIKAALAEKKRLLELEEKHAEQLAQREQLAQERLALAQQWQSEIVEAFQGQLKKERQQSLEELQSELVAKRNEWQEKLTQNRTLINRLQDDPEAVQAELDLAEMKLIEAEEFIFLLDNQLKLAQIEHHLEQTDTAPTEQPPELRILKARAEELRLLQDQLAALADLLQSKRVLLKQRQEVIDKRSNLDADHQQQYQQVQNIFLRLSAELTQQLDEISNLQNSLEAWVNELETTYLTQKKQGLTVRHRLPDSGLQWQSLNADFMSIPATALQIIRSTALSLGVAMQQATAGVWAVLIVLEMLWLVVIQGLGRLASTEHIQPEHSSTYKALLMGSALLKSTRYDLLLGGLIIIAAWQLDIVAPGLSVIIALFGVWLGVRVTILLSRWVLDSSFGFPQRQPLLNRLIAVYAILVALFGLVLILAHLEALSVPLREVLDRIFMLLLIPPALLALRIRRLLIDIMQEKKQTTYWVRLLGLVSLAIPLVIMSAAILGIIGFVNLAWYLAGYLVIVISILMAWLIVRGLVIEFAHHIQLVLEQRSQQSAFWVKSLVEPLHYLLRLVLFLAMIWIIYRLFVVDPTTGFDLKAWLMQPLFSVGKTSINSLDLLGSLLLLVLVFYIGRWSREVTYNWIYRNIRDLGVRNSLSVFTQYAVVVVGLFVALNIIGINLTSLTVFAGALGVGIGFGLQNIANNFISGLILLAERPVRTKDWVTIGEREGVVSQIGMRSVTLTTWDNQDVIIPNSDLVSNAFINWTRTNNVVRTVLAIGIHYQDDPHKAQAVIEETVSMQPEVLLDPPPHVWLHAFATSSVDFRIYYYMDVNQFSRLDVKSKVLFAIWDALKEAGIKIPYPQQDVYIKEFPLEGIPHNQPC